MCTEMRVLRILIKDFNKFLIQLTNMSQAQGYSDSYENFVKNISPRDGKWVLLSNIPQAPP